MSTIACVCRSVYQKSTDQKEGLMIMLQTTRSRIRPLVGFGTSLCLQNYPNVITAAAAVGVKLNIAHSYTVPWELNMNFTGILSIQICLNKIILTSKYFQTNKKWQVIEFLKKTITPEYYQNIKIDKENVSLCNERRHMPIYRAQNTTGSFCLSTRSTTF